MAEERDDDDEFIDGFREHLSQADNVVHVVLNGHLEVEGHLDNVLRVVFFHPEHFEKLQLDFGQRIQIARAYSPAPDARDWRIIRGLNSLRNEI